MATSAAKYLPDDDGDLDRPKMTADAGRRCVRNLNHYTVLSAEWMALVESLKQLRRLVHIDGRCPVNTKLSAAQGRNTDSKGTLWDQEAQENAIRILVEEAKVNLCLRMMNEFKKWEYNPSEKESTLKKVAVSTGTSEAQLKQKCSQFEESLGLLLWRAFAHVETLQLMDVPLLLDHCAMVLNTCDLTGVTDPKMQETLVLHYFLLLMQHSEALANSELLPKSRELDLLHLVTSHILCHIQGYNLEILTAFAEGLSAMAYNEDFMSDWEMYFKDPTGEEKELEKKKNFLELEEKVLAPVLKEYPTRKKDFRPLMDLFKKVGSSLPG